MLLLKFILAPALIGLVSLAGRKWGPAIAGWLLGLPLNAGPVLAFLLIERGPGFTADAARGSLLGILAWAAFCLAYAYCCLRMRWWWSALIGWLAYSIIALILLPVRAGVVQAFAMVVLILAGVLLGFPRPPQPDMPAQQNQRDIWWRMATAVAMVVALTSAAGLLGPTRSGLLTVSPAYTTILAVFSHRQGPVSALRMLRGVSAGLYTAATFFLALSLALRHLGGIASFAWAAAAALFVQGLSLAYVRRQG